MITPEELLKNIDQQIDDIKVVIIDLIGEHLETRAYSLKEMQAIPYELDYQVGLNFDEKTVHDFIKFKKYIVEEIIKDYACSGWTVWTEEKKGACVLHFATEKIMKYRESCKVGYDK